MALRDYEWRAWSYSSLSQFLKSADASSCIGLLLTEPCFSCRSTSLRPSCHLRASSPKDSSSEYSSSYSYASSLHWLCLQLHHLYLSSADTTLIEAFHALICHLCSWNQWTTESGWSQKFSSSMRICFWPDLSLLRLTTGAVVVDTTQ